jgi:hypothetical protein
LQQHFIGTVADYALEGILAGPTDGAATVFASTISALLASGDNQDAAIAGDLATAFGDAIEKCFTDTTISVSAASLAGSITPAILCGGPLSAAVLAAFKKQANQATEYCAKVGSVLTLARSAAEDSGRGLSFDAAAAAYLAAALDDSGVQMLALCAPAAFRPLSV